MSWFGHELGGRVGRDRPCDSQRRRRPRRRHQSPCRAPCAAPGDGHASCRDDLVVPRGSVTAPKDREVPEPPFGGDGNALLTQAERQTRISPENKSSGRVPCGNARRATTLLLQRRLPRNPRPRHGHGPGVSGAGASLSGPEPRRSRLPSSSAKPRFVSG